MKKIVSALLISVSMLAAGMLFFAYQRNIILLNFHADLPKTELASPAQKQSITFHYFKNGSWQTQQLPVLVYTDETLSMQHVVSRLLQLLLEEKIVDRKVTLQESTKVFGSNEIILSFDKPLWGKQLATHEKWLIIQSLFKTLLEIAPAPQKVRILVDHQPFIDLHLDFTNPWPIDAFTT